MRYHTTEPISAMEIRDKARLVKEATNGNDVRIMIRGCWTAWVNGDEYSETTIDFPSVKEVTNLGTRYAEIMINGRPFEVKPELCEEGFELIIEPTNPASRLEGLPPSLIQVVLVLVSLLSDSIVESVYTQELARTLDITPVKLGVYLELLEELNLVNLEVVNRKKVVSIV